MDTHAARCRGHAGVGFSPPPDGAVPGDESNPPEINPPLVTCMSHGLLPVCHKAFDLHAKGPVTFTSNGNNLYVTWRTAKYPGTYWEIGDIKGGRMCT